MRGLLILLLLLSGCASRTVYKPVNVDVPFTVRCHAPKIEIPAWPLQKLSRDASLFEKVKMTLVELELRKGYEAQLESAVRACL